MGRLSHRVLAAVLVIALAGAGAADAAARKSYGVKKGFPVGPGQVVAQIILQALGLSSTSATVGSPFSATVTNTTAGSTLVLTNNVGGKYSLSTGTLSGTGLTAGTDNPVIQETLAAATNSPRSTTLTITVTAPGSGGQFFFPDGGDLMLPGAAF